MMVYYFTLKNHYVNFSKCKVTIQNKYLNKMHGVIVSYDMDNYKCYNNSTYFRSDDKIDILDTNEIVCKSIDKNKEYNGLVLVSNPTVVVGDIEKYYAKRGEKVPTNTITLIPLFTNEKGDYIHAIIKKPQDNKDDKGVKDDKQKTLKTFNLIYNDKSYPVGRENSISVRDLIKKSLPSDEYDIENIRLVNKSTLNNYYINDTLYDEGSYIADVKPLITFTVDGDKIKFEDNPSKTSLTIPLSLETPKLKVKDHYKFTGWTSSKGNWNNIHLSLNTPVKFVGNAILKQWTVKFKDCGSDIITKTVTVTDGDMVTPPECKKTGYTLKKWKEESFCTCKSSDISIWLLVILFIISVIVVFIPSKSSYIRNITRGIQSKTSY